MRRVEVSPVRTHVVVGGRDEVRAALARAQGCGRLVEVREVAVLPEGQLHVVADLREPAALPLSVRRRPWLIAGGVVAAVVVAGGVVWLVVLAVLALVALVSSVVAWLAANLMWFGVAAVIAILVSTGGAAACAGLHCGGCRG